MNPRIDVSPDKDRWPDRAVVRQLARRLRKAARAMGCDNEELEGLTLRIVGDGEMTALKETHFGVAEATDILSFPAGEAIPGEDEFAPGLGELVLNREAVTRQATRPGTQGWLDEATSLSIHGVAHLLGHDHGERREARRMKATERRGHRAVGLPCVRPYG
ncbi:MAG: rRNA maturation RNase YbeY [Myxococcota bacterium]